MDGRCSAVLTFALLSAVGCTSAQKVPGLESPQAAAVIAPAQAAPVPQVAAAPPAKRWGVSAMFQGEKATQKKPATLAIMAKLQVESATVEGRSPRERDQLLDAARGMYQEALAIEPTNLEALKGLAEFYETFNDHAQARVIYERAMHAHPRDAQLRHDLGMTFARKKDFETASTLVSEALKIDPDNRTYRKTYGFCLVRCGKADEGYQWLSRCMPEDEARVNVSKMLFQMGQDEGAKRHLTLANQANPTNTTAHQMMAQLNGGVTVPVATTQTNYVEPEPVGEVPLLLPVPAKQPPAMSIRTASARRVVSRSGPEPVLMSSFDEPSFTKAEPFPASSPTPKSFTKPLRTITPLP